jgi:hypothetical protein
MAEGLPVERLRQFLRELKPEARAMLIGELERGLLRGDEMPGAELVLQELRRSAREAGRPSPRVGNLARLFFQPLEPFLVDDVATHVHPGRIARAVLDPIWQWIARDLLPGEAKAVSEDVARAYADHDNARAEALARAFQDRACARIKAALQAAETDERAMRRLTAQIVTPRPIEHVQAILDILDRREGLVAFSAQLPRHIKTLTDGAIDNIRALLKAPECADPKFFLYALLLVMGRLSAPWQLIKLATRAAGSDVAARVAETPFAVAVEIALAELERMVGELKSELRTGRGVAVGALLKSIHDAVRGIRSEVDLSLDSNWGRRLAALRSDIAGMLTGEIESMPGRVRRLLRPRPAKEIATGSTLDPGDVEEAEALIAFVGTCRLYADELAIKEVTQRAYSELQNYLEGNSQMLIDALRQATDADRSFRQSQVDAALRFCTLVFGQDYAAVMAKAAGVAAQGERKAAQ